jgi:single-strand DNA-binding protein
MYCKVILTGRLARDPDIHHFEKGGSVCKMRVLTSRAWRDRDSGEMREKVEGHNIAIYVENIAKRAAENCRKGDVVLIEGTLETRRWEDGEHGYRYMTEVAIRPFIGSIRRMPLAKREGEPTVGLPDADADPFEGDGGFSGFEDDDFPI